MQVERFEWCLFLGGDSPVNFRVRSTNYGDGYTQVAGDGINTRAVSHNLSVRGRQSKINAVMDFFDRHAGHKPFEIDHPLMGLGLFRCESYTPVPLGAGIWSINFQLIPFNRSTT